MAGMFGSPSVSDSDDCPAAPRYRLPSVRAIPRWPDGITCDGENPLQYCPRVSLPSDPSQIYLGGEPVEDAARAAKHRLVRESAGAAAAPGDDRGRDARLGRLDRRL